MQPAANARRLRAVMTPERRLLVQQFARFGTVGAAGAVVDIATVYAAMAALGLYLSGLLAYFAAVTTTWALNRAWTFAGRRGGGGLLRQWLLFVAANGVGFVLNRGTFFVLVTLLPVCAEYPVIAILAGVGAGMFANFNLSRSVVFPEEAELRSPDGPAQIAHAIPLRRLGPRANPSGFAEEASLRARAPVLATAQPAAVEAVTRVAAGASD